MVSLDASRDLEPSTQCRRRGKEAQSGGGGITLFQILRDVDKKVFGSRQGLMPYSFMREATRSETKFCFYSYLSPYLSSTRSTRVYKNIWVFCLKLRKYDQTDVLHKTSVESFKNESNKRWKLAGGYDHLLPCQGRTL